MGQTNARYNTSTLAAMVDIAKSEGLLAFYKGYSAKVARLAPGSAIIFVVYEHIMGLLGSGK